MEILEYESRQGTSYRKLVKVFYEQFGVSLATMTIHNWCETLGLTPRQAVRPEKEGSKLPPIPPEALP